MAARTSRKGEDRRRAPADLELSSSLALLPAATPAMPPRGPPVPTMHPAAHIGNRRGRAHGREGRTARWRRDGRRNAEKAEAGRQDACDDKRTHLNLLGLVVDAHLRVACGSVEIHISVMARQQIKLWRREVRSVEVHVCLERRSESRWERSAESRASMAWCRNALPRVAQRRLGLASCVPALIVVFGTATAEAQDR